MEAFKFLLIRLAARSGGSKFESTCRGSSRASRSMIRRSPLPLAKQTRSTPKCSLLARCAGGRTAICLCRPSNGLLAIAIQLASIRGRNVVRRGRFRTPSIRPCRQTLHRACGSRGETSSSRTSSVSRLARRVLSTTRIPNLLAIHPLRLQCVPPDADATSQ